MGKTPKPLRILVTDRDLYDMPQLETLRAQGHTVELAHGDDSEFFDLYLGRRCWYMDQPHIAKYLADAIYAARARVYAKAPA